MEKQESKQLEQNIHWFTYFVQLADIYKLEISSINVISSMLDSDSIGDTLSKLITMSESIMQIFSTALLYTPTEPTPLYTSKEPAPPIVECCIDKVKAINKLDRQLNDSADDTGDDQWLREGRGRQ